MRKALLRIAMATALCAPTAAYAVDAVYGVWVREGHPNDKLEFYDCSGKLCAKGIEAMPDGSPAPEVLRNAAKTTPNHWEGEINDPESGKTYIGKIALDSPTSLTMTGCLVAFLCQSETWTKVSGPTKPAADAKPAGQPAAKPAAPASDAKEPAAAKPAAHEPAAKETAKPAAKATKPAKGKTAPPAQ
ncbi:DUF2147 domain-containing protein [Methylocystis sp. SC2]|uniref:DUF2147 domain-containing protein n=1 Tax=Methylocystis sp. (strain SC2) TaxID=187303 RepID=UPI00027AF139|nr:DUF2147 domain-containing protein [Methylocystis sp. SC2]CCJ08301.1 Conserved hypothetical protein [Methylocystis sp. SC2]